MTHLEKKLFLDPEIIEKGSFLATFMLCFLLLINSHSFNSIAHSAVSRSTLQKIEAKGRYLLDMGLTEDVAKKEVVKDLDNSYAE